jgi:hypothetical protein
MSRYPRSMVETSEADYFREQADRCIRLSKSIDDGEAIATLRNMAMEYQIKARWLDEAESAAS